MRGVRPKITNLKEEKSYKGEVHLTLFAVLFTLVKKGLKTAL